MSPKLFSRPVVLIYMDLSRYQKLASKFFWILLVLVCLVPVLIWLSAPYFVDRKPGMADKANNIINNLRYIDAAKHQWALEHGITNSVQAARFTQPLSWKDIAPYLLEDPNAVNISHPDTNGVIPPVSGEVYEINLLNKLPDAKLPHDVVFLPKGTYTLDAGEAWSYPDPATNN